MDASAGRFSISLERVAWLNVCRLRYHDKLLEFNDVELNDLIHAAKRAQDISNNMRRSAGLPELRMFA